jgi:hypothetical protein
MIKELVIRLNGAIPKRLVGRSEYMNVAVQRHTVQCRGRMRGDIDSNDPAFSGPIAYLASRPYPRFSEYQRMS